MYILRPFLQTLEDLHGRLNRLALNPTLIQTLTPSHTHSHTLFRHYSDSGRHLERRFRQFQYGLKWQP